MYGPIGECPRLSDPSSRFTVGVVRPLRSGFLPICLITVWARRARCLTPCKLRLAYLRADALMQSHRMPSWEVSSDCLRNQIHPYSAALAAPSRLSISDDQSATTYRKLVCLDACSTDDPLRLPTGTPHGSRRPGGSVSPIGRLHIF